MPTRPLRSYDPRVLGGYELLEVLGEGGMGAVYLARDRAGRLVAIKIIRPEYAAQAEFRGRFRSEVNRARQVPPFCTAAVLDADPDHETPYLVVEYVDGPHLAEIVADRGPLSGGDLHSVAVGVATALVAIHGAGVIHRDLKPRNVLFALGAPKVIDFGIARALEPTSEHTRTDQMVGTLSYMAPERLDGAAVTPAVDVFAWGVLVAYAATGRTPFAADSPTATAMRILTGRPDLGGLTGPLRDLVGSALAKDPAARPTAQELLDHLLAAEPYAATVSLPRHLAHAPAPREPATGASGHGPQGIDLSAPARHRPRRRRLAWTAAVAAGLVAAAVPLAIAAREGSTPVAAPVAPTSAPPSLAPNTAPPELADISFVDPLTSQGNWRESSTENYDCTPGPAGLTITAETYGDGYVCPGPATSFRDDQSIVVEFEQLSDDACAVVGFRREGRAGYRLGVCDDVVRVAQVAPDPGYATVGSAAHRLKSQARHRIVVSIVDQVATINVDGAKVLAQVLDPERNEGKIELGLSQHLGGERGRVRFAGLQIRPL